MEIKDTIVDGGSLKEALRRGLRDDTVEIVEVRHHCLSTKGLNFLSEIFKASVRYVTGSNEKKRRTEGWTVLVIKLEPRGSDGFKGIVQQQDLFRTECRVLRDVLPKVEDLVDAQIGPRLLYGSEESKILIMADLTRRGFDMKDRQKGLPLDHCAVVMQKLAKLHAGSVALCEKDETIKSFRNGVVSPQCPAAYVRLMEVSLLRISSAIEKWSDEACSRTADKLRKLAKTIGPRCVDVYNYEDDEFCVLNHGDCWINNMMFKETEKGRLVDVVLIDYQYSVYTSPAVDLLYFLTICPEVEIKCDKDDYLLEVYLNTLTRTMRSIGCKTKPPTMEKLKKSIHDRRIYAVFSGLVLYLRMIGNKEDTEDFNEVLNVLSGETKMDVFKNPRAVKAARKMIPVMHERGYFD